MSDLEETISFDELKVRAKSRIQIAESLGWTQIEYIYDDMWGGIYLGGINSNGEWGHVPEFIGSENDETK